MMTKSKRTQSSRVDGWKTIDDAGPQETQRLWSPGDVHIDRSSAPPPTSAVPLRQCTCTRRPDCVNTLHCSNALCSIPAALIWRWRCCCCCCEMKNRVTSPSWEARLICTPPRHLCSLARWPRAGRQTGPWEFNYLRAQETNDTAFHHSYTSKSPRWLQTSSALSFEDRLYESPSHWAHVDCHAAPSGLWGFV